MSNISRQYIHKALAPIKPLRFLKGYYQVVIILYLCIDDWDFHNDLGDIYLEVSQLCHCNPDSIERNIRTMLLSIDFRVLSAMVGYEIEAIPTVKDFIDILVTYITRDYINTI